MIDCHTVTIDFTALTPSIPVWSIALLSAPCIRWKKFTRHFFSFSGPTPACKSFGILCSFLFELYPHSEHTSLASKPTSSSIPFIKPAVLLTPRFFICISGCLSAFFLWQLVFKTIWTYSLEFLASMLKTYPDTRNLKKEIS